MSGGALRDGFGYFLSWIPILRLILLNSEDFSGLSSRDTLKSFESAKHYFKLYSKWFKLYSKWSQVNCVRGLIKEGNETKNWTVYKPERYKLQTLTQERS